MSRGCAVPDERTTPEVANLERLAGLMFSDLDEAKRSLPQEEQDAYRDAQRSVVEARRNAETKEGLLRIN